jgi:hypothetical protein
MSSTARVSRVGGISVYAGAPDPTNLSTMLAVAEISLGFQYNYILLQQDILCGFRADQNTIPPKVVVPKSTLGGIVLQSRVIGNQATFY